MPVVLLGMLAGLVALDDLGKFALVTLAERNPTVQADRVSERVQVRVVADGLLVISVRVSIACIAFLARDRGLRPDTDRAR
jgi:hypothetical protein